MILTLWKCNRCAESVLGHPHLYLEVKEPLPTSDKHFRIVHTMHLCAACAVPVCGAAVGSGGRWGTGERIQTRDELYWIGILVIGAAVISGVLGLIFGGLAGAWIF